MNTDNKQNNENKQLTELTEEELKEVTGRGMHYDCSLPENKNKYECYMLLSTKKKCLEIM